MSCRDWNVPRSGGTAHAGRRPDPGERRRPPRRAAAPVRGPHRRPSIATAAPQVVRTPTAPTSGCSTARSIPNIGLNAVAGRPKEEYGVEPTAFDEMRPGCYDVARARQGHERGRRARLDELPVVPGLRGPAVRRRRRQGPRPRRGPGLQRLAHRRVVRRATRTASSRWRCRCCGTPSWRPPRCAASPRKGCHSMTFTENPATLGYPSFHDDVLGSGLARAVDDEHRASRSTSARRVSSRSPRPTRRST